MGRHLEFHGDHQPVRVMCNGAQIGGAVIRQASGNGAVQWESPYNAALPAAVFSGACEQEPALLPDGYDRAEYLESSGRQYIDTGFVPQKDTLFLQLSLAFMSAPTTASTGAFGTGVSGLGRCLFASTQGSWTAGQLAVQFGETTLLTGHSIAELRGTAFSLRVEDGRLYFNDTAAAGTYTGNYENSRNLFLFMVNQADVAAQLDGAFVRIYGAKMGLGGEILRDFVPCVRRADNKPGLYDRCGSICPLTGTPFYVNGGDGEFSFASAADASAPYPTRAIRVCDPVWTLGAQTVDLTEPELRGIGDVRDTFDAQTGILTRRIGKAVLTGREGGWAYSSDSCYFNGALPQAEGMARYLCSHTGADLWVGLNDTRIFWLHICTALGITDLDEGSRMQRIKQYLADEAAAGRPVTIYYVLSVPVVERLEPQPLRQTVGSNALTQTAGSVAGSAAVDYYAADQA